MAAVGGAQVCSGQAECAVPARRMWRAAFTDSHLILPKAVPDSVSHVSYDDGPGSNATPGITSRTIHFHRSYAEAKAKERQSEKVVLHVKERLVVVDREGMRLKLKMVEGGLLDTYTNWATQSVHIEEKGPNACVVHWCFEYEPLSEEQQSKVQLVLNEYVPRGYKKLEQYLLSHDD